MPRGLVLALMVAVGLVGFSTQPVSAQSLDNLRAEAEAGDPAAMYALARAYERGTGVARDDFAAVRWLRRAAENGHGPAALDLGWMLANGYGTTKDEADAYYWFARAAAAGVEGAAAQRDFLAPDVDPDARREADARVAELTMPAPAPEPDRGMAVTEGAEVPPTEDLRDVFALRRAYNSPERGDDADLRGSVERLAERGDALAQNLMGVMLMRSTARADKLAALEWFKAAAWQGLPAAQYNLADSLAAGVAGQLDLPAAAEWLDRAEAGLPDDASADYDTVARLFKERAEYRDPYRAALQGYRSAARELGELIRLRRAEINARLELARRLGQ